MRRRDKTGGKAAKTQRLKTVKRRSTAVAARRRKPSAVDATERIARLTRERNEALEQLEATSEVLRVISSSPGELEPAFNTMLANAVRICEAQFGSVLSFAGLWDEWQDIENGEIVKSCTIIVTDANEFTRKIHDRMPVVLSTKQLPPWLTGKEGAELLKPAPESTLQMWPVSRKVNRVGNDSDATLIEALQ